MKRVAIIIALILCIAFPFPAYAENFTGTDGSLTIELVYDNKPVSGIRVGIYYVATVAGKTPGVPEYTLTGGFTGFTHNKLNLLKSGSMEADVNKELSLALQSYAKAPGRNLQPLNNTYKSTNAQGTVEFTGLNAGMYLIVQENVPATGYRITPALIPVPAYDDKAKIWKYAFTVHPKTEYIPGGGDGDGDRTPGGDGDGDRRTNMPDPDVPLRGIDDNPTMPIDDDPIPLADLPQTGLLRWPVPVLGVFGSLLILAGLLVRREERA